MNLDPYEIGLKVGLIYMPFLFALCFHELAHGWVAKLKGDNTAETMGRITMNPMAHMDPVGTFLLPLIAIIFPMGIFFGWAKPVPVNPNNLKSPKKDMFWIAAAGPLSNILLSIIAVLLLAFSIFLSSSLRAPVMEMLKFFIQINLFLAVFNMIPLHPLDGGKVLARFLPDNANRYLEENQQILQMILMVLIFTGGLRIMAGPIIYIQQEMLHIASQIASLLIS